MKTRAVASTMMAFSLAIFSAPTVGAQHDGHPTGINPSPVALEGKPKPHEHMMMANAPHHVLAMAHHSNLAVFAKALQDQTARGVALDADFSRAAVAEIRRSFDQMKQHHQEHMQKMSGDMHAEMSGMIERMETHQAELNTQLTALERELQLTTPDRNNVYTLAASVNSHLDAMATTKHECMGMKPKAKM